MEFEYDLTISIVNTNNRDLLRDCLQSIYDNTRRISFEIIVVDNASTDGSVEMVKEEFPDVQMVINRLREGYGYSLNKGIRSARGEFILIFNEDMIVLPNSLDIMVERIRKDSKIGALGCRLLNLDLTLQHSCFSFPTLRQEILESFFPYKVIFPEGKFRLKMFYWAHDEEREVDIIMGCCMLIPKKVFDHVGLFDTQFFVYAEELDLCRRIKDAGYNIIFTPEARIIHIGGQTSKSISIKMYLVKMESKFKYFRKHHGVMSSTIVKGLTGVGAIIRIIGWCVYWILKRENRNDVEKYLLRYWKTLRLIRGTIKPLEQ